MLSPEEFASRFLARTPLPSGRLEGLYGRFMKGIADSDFRMLSDERGKRISFVCGPELLQVMLGLTPAAACLRVGRRITWLEERMKDGTRHKLALFPAAGVAVKATWDGVFDMIATAFGSEVFARLQPHIPLLKSAPIHEIDPENKLCAIAELPVAEKLRHPDFMSVERFMSPSTEGTLYNARAFLYHSIGCNVLFTGTGYSREGEPEWITLNRPVADIPGVVLLDLEVTEADLAELKAAAW